MTNLLFFPFPIFVVRRLVLLIIILRPVVLFWSEVELVFELIVGNGLKYELVFFVLGFLVFFLVG